MKQSRSAGLVRVKITTGLHACEKSLLFLIQGSLALLSEGLFCYFSERADVCFVLTPTATSFFASFFAEKKEGWKEKRNFL